MLEDRDYMRQPDFGGSRWRPDFHLRWSWTNGLILANFVIFVLLEICKVYFSAGFVFVAQYCMLSTEGLRHGFVWQLFTFQFLHFGPYHFLGNMMGLFFLGSAVEAMLGGKRFITLYLTSGFVGGILQSLLGLIIPIFGIPVVGASAGVFGLLAAFATLQPEVDFLLFFILPIKAKHLAIGGGMVALFYTIVPAEPGIAHAAHLGGLIMGWIYVKKILTSPSLLGVEEEEKPLRYKAVKSQPKEAEEPEDADVDAVLDKISARGINSLTSKERAILEAARKKMAQH